MTHGTDTAALTIRGTRRGAVQDGYEPLTIETDQGGIKMRLYGVPGATTGAVFVGDAWGGWDTPGHGRLFPDLCADLQAAGIAALRVRYRRPAELSDCALDLLTGLRVLASQGVGATVLTGHSFGGAVVAQAAANAPAPQIRSLVLLSTQSHAVEAIARVSPGCSALLIHGTEDEVLPADCSRYAYDLAGGEKRLSLYEGARHGLDEGGQRLRREVRGWILGELGADEQPYG